MPALLAAASALSVWLGQWEGTSLCLVRPSACNDERVVYVITAAGAGVELKADKIVGGERLWMGTLSCTGDGAALRCPIPKGTFSFTRDGDEAHGSLVLTDGTRFRAIEVARARR